MSYWVRSLQNKDDTTNNEANISITPVAETTRQQHRQEQTQGDHATFLDTMLGSSDPIDSIASTFAAIAMNFAIATVVAAC